MSNVPALAAAGLNGFDLSAWHAISHARAKRRYASKCSICSNNRGDSSQERIELAFLALAQPKALAQELDRALVETCDAINGSIG